MILAASLAVSYSISIALEYDNVVLHGKKSETPSSVGNYPNSVPPAATPIPVIVDLSGLRRTAVMHTVHAING
jgi:hypothetical protein